ncbi:MAG: DNA polymerase III subunit delta [Ruminococcaceae bacterium]|nr:DNA polymerase III subunit delta [Oscillospiraceae bacterium]
MSIIFETALKNEIKNTARNVYILFGNDGYLKNLYANKISGMCAEPDDIFNFQKFSGDCDLQEVYDAVLQFPMMSDKKCVILTDYDFEKCSKSDFEKLCTIISDTPESCVFILLYDVLEIVAKKNTKLSKLVTAAEKNNGVAAELNHRTVPDLIKMLTAGAAKRGCKFEGAAARYLVETSGEDINTLKNELEKLCNFVGSGEITKQTVDEICIKTVEASVYTLSKHIIECNMSAALKILDELFYLKVEPIIILSTISGFYVDMYRTFVGKERAMTAPEIAQAFDYKNREFVIRNAVSDVKKFTSTKFLFSFDALRAADKSLKSFSSDPRVVLEQLLVKLGYIAIRGECLD